MKYLLDTCVLAEFKKKQPEQKVLDWLNNQIEPTLFLSVITIGEIQKGISILPNSKRKTGLEKWLKTLIYRYDRRIIALDIDEMKTWGELNGKLAKKGFVFPFLDSLIAATVLTHKMTLVTRNEADFKNTGVKILNIWK
ncbi:MAG: type II toxin-antitoxin system VapC family toxin [Aridibacter sp.]